MRTFTLNYLHGYLVENPIKTLIIRCHIVLLVWFIERALASCDVLRQPSKKLPRHLRSKWTERNCKTKSAKGTFHSLQILYFRKKMLSNLIIMRKTKALTLIQ